MAAREFVKTIRIFCHNPKCKGMDWANEGGCPTCPENCEHTSTAISAWKEKGEENGETSTVQDT